MQQDRGSRRVKCPTCNAGTGEETHLRCRDYISGESFQTVRCVKCGLIYVNPRPVDIGRYYPLKHQISEPAAYERADARARIRFLSGLAPGRSRTILDIGCGKGLLLAGLKKRGWIAYGTELSEISGSVAKSAGLTVYNCAVEDCGFAAGYFDVIALFHSLEHLEEPRKTLSHLRSLLKAEGRLVIEVPNIGSWHARRFGSHWFHLDVPRHLVHFGRESLTRMVCAEGFRIVKTTTHNIQYDAFGTVQSLLNIALPANLLNSFSTGQISLGELWRKDKAFGIAALGLSELVLWLGFPLAALAEICTAPWIEGGTLRIVAAR